MAHIPTKNGTVCLNDNVVFSAVLDDRFLLAKWMELEGRVQRSSDKVKESRLLQSG